MKGTQSLLMLDREEMLNTSQLQWVYEFLLFIPFKKKDKVKLYLQTNMLLLGRV